MGTAPHLATDGKLFIYDGELIQGQGTLIELPNQWFNLTPMVTVPTTATNIHAQLAANQNSATLGPFVAGAVDTLEIWTRFVMVIPNKYVGLFLSQPDGVQP
jgi:hypothetical protein